MNLLEFWDQDVFKNHYVDEPGWQHMYVRKSDIYVGGERVGPTLHFVRIEATKPGTGAWTRLLATLDEKLSGVNLYVENIFNDRFADHLRSDPAWTELPKYSPLEPSSFVKRVSVAY